MCAAVLSVAAVSCDRQGTNSGSGEEAELNVRIEDFGPDCVFMAVLTGGEEIAVRAAVDGTPEIRKFVTDANGGLTPADGFGPLELAEGAGSMDIDAWYPYSESVEKWSVRSNQADGEGYLSGYFAAAFGFKAVAGANEIPLYPQTARLVVNIMPSEQVSALEMVGVRIGNGNMALDGTFTPPASGHRYGSWTAGEATGSILPVESDADGIAAISCQAVIIPQDMSGKELVTLTLADGRELSYILPDDAGSFEAGKSYGFDLYAYGDMLSAEEPDFSGYAPEDLKPGDYFYSDGTWSDGGLRSVSGSGLVWEDEKPSPLSGKKVIGIVFCTDPERIGQGEKDALAAIGVQEPHGLVVSTIASSYNGYVKWYDNNGDYIRDETEIGLSEVGADLPGDEVFSLIDADIEGYRNNMIMRTERADDIDAGHYPGFRTALDFAAEAGGPDASAKTTGWYIPSNGQLVDIVRNLTGADLNGSNFVCDTDGIIFWQGLGNTPARLNELMSLVDNLQKTEYPGYNNALMSSTQGNAETMRYIDFTESGYLDCLRDYKNRGTHVRCVLAF